MFEQQLDAIENSFKYYKERFLKNYHLMIFENEM
ncbi:7 transmembrane receptor [Trichinella spiralis]|nr:7 transmembrane receptor [Trichinella spiralis]